MKSLKTTGNTGFYSLVKAWTELRAIAPRVQEGRVDRAQPGSRGLGYLCQTVYAAKVGRQVVLTNRAF